MGVVDFKHNYFVFLDTKITTVCVLLKTNCTLELYPKTRDKNISRDVWSQYKYTVSPNSYPKYPMNHGP